MKQRMLNIGIAVDQLAYVLLTLGGPVARTKPCQQRPTGRKAMASCLGASFVR